MYLKIKMKKILHQIIRESLYNLQELHLKSPHVTFSVLFEYIFSGSNDLVNNNNK